MKIFSLRTNKNVMFWSIALGLAVNLFVFTLVQCADALATPYQGCKIGFPLQFDETYYIGDLHYALDEGSHNEGSYSVGNFAAFLTHVTFWVNLSFWILVSFVVLMIVKWFKDRKTIKKINS